MRPAKCDGNFKTLSLLKKMEVKKMNKKGISPLIATVLLIGFTIALAAVVMIWGQNLFQQTTEQTGEQASSQIKCIQEVDIDIISATNANPIVAMVDNKGEATIVNAIAKVYFTDNTVTVVNGNLSTSMFNNTLVAYGRNQISISYSGAGALDKVEILPVTTSDKGTNLICAQKSDIYDF